ncbi:hypothetical protein CSKR_102780 [Clonorchis sinensis]|uniref:Uncharacterized protein n=1 Tax=Clonorchis sinensis TaxID=79923 RepID=A0A3R7FLA0_CLOSI|nr:hypothetical protein CSKR_102780 [Clonorchis sinensis]
MTKLNRSRKSGYPCRTPPSVGQLLERFPYALMSPELKSLNPEPWISEKLTDCRFVKQEGSIDVYSFQTDITLEMEGNTLLPAYVLWKVNRDVGGESGRCRTFVGPVSEPLVSVFPVPGPVNGLTCEELPPKGTTRAGILPGCPSLDRGSREAEVGFEPRTFRLTRNPAESLVDDISRQVNVLHQAASCFSCYDIRDIVTHVYT